MDRILPFFILALLMCGCIAQEDAAIAATTTSSPVSTSSTLEATASSTTTSSSTTSTAELGTTTSTTSSSSSTFASSTSPTLGIDKSRASIALNKGTYKSGEQMRVDVKIDAPRAMRDVDVHVYGIFAGTRFWLNKSSAIDLNPGMNNVSFYYTTPQCNKCAGIAAGTYAVEVEVLYLDKRVAHDIKSVSLIQ